MQMGHPVVGPIKYRRYGAPDAQATRAVFHTAVRDGAAGHYTLAQRRAWAGSRVAPPGWNDRLTSQHTIVATHEGRVVGFMSMDSRGYLDLAFVRPEMRGTGVAGQLYDKIESWACRRGLARLTTEASLMARPFLQRKGWTVLIAQAMELRGQYLRNFHMEKAV